MFGILDISTSGLVAQRTRMETVAANMANSSTILDAKGKYAPYRRRAAELAAGDPVSGRSQGVHVSEIKLDRTTPMRRKWEPDSPFAKDGYVEYPNVSPEVELINAMEISRAYEANMAAAEATKSMMTASLRLLA